MNTLNEERDLRGTLRTLSWCDEVVVVDMYSDDNTVAIAREFTDKVFLHERVGFVEPARAFVIDQSSGDWILVVDADELIPPSLAQELRKIARQDVADVVRIPRRNFVLGEWIQHTGWWPDPQTRFFKRGAVEPTQPIHTQMTPVADARVLELSVADEHCMIHLSSVDLTDLMNKVNSYTSVESRQMWDAGDRFDWSTASHRTLNEFRLRYFDLNGLGDGDRGLLLSTVMGFYRFLSWMKLWELEHNPLPGSREAAVRESILGQWATFDKETGHS